MEVDLAELKKTAKKKVKSAPKPPPKPRRQLFYKVAPRETLKEMENNWLSGWDEERLSRVYHYPVDEVKHWVRTKLVNKYSSRYERITLIFDNLFEAAETAHQVYLAAPTNSASMAYTSIVNSIRGAMVDLDNVQDNQELADDILKLALNPLVKKVTQCLIDELGSFKEEIMLRFSEDDANRISNEVATRVGSHFKTALKETTARLDTILGARDKNKRKALEGKVKKKHNHLRSVPSE